MEAPCARIDIQEFVTPIAAIVLEFDFDESAVIDRAKKSIGGLFDLRSLQSFHKCTGETKIDRVLAGAPGHQLPALDVPDVDDLGGQVLRSELRLPEVGELDVIRHFTHLAQRNFSIDSVFYPLGSCTMKYNPRVNEDVARLPGIAHVHPLQPDETVQGALRIMFELQQILAAITGFKTATLQPAAGAQGELAGMLMMRAYHLDRGDTQRRKVLVPDSAHGTNPATAAMCGFQTVSIPSDANGDIDVTD